MSEPVAPSEGRGVVHLFCKPTADFDQAAAIAAIEKAQADDVQVVTVSMLGHKADVAIMAMHPDWWALRKLQSAVTKAGLDVVDSFVSLTEISEYAAGVPEEMRNMRLYPDLTDVVGDKPAWCFYPMSKKREGHANWFEVPFEERKELMYDHGKSGRQFTGRILQVITGATGIDDWEWGVTLFGQHPDDLKETVYTMRFDKASSTYAEFGPFYAGIAAAPSEVFAAL